MIFLMHFFLLICLLFSGEIFMSNINKVHRRIIEIEDLSLKEYKIYFCTKLLVSSKNIEQAYEYLMPFAPKKNQMLKKYYDYYQKKIDLFFIQKCDHINKSSLRAFIKKEYNEDLPKKFPNWVIDLKAMIRQIKL